MCNILTRKDKHRRKVKCLNTGFVFESIAAAKKWLGRDVKILGVLKGENKTAGTHPETNEPLYWEEVYFERDEQEEEVDKRKLICLTTNEIFDSIANAVKEYKLSEGISSTISKAARGIRETAGKHPETGEPLEWEYITV